MVEGHQCHRVAAAHRRLLLGKVFKASSPNRRFVDGAAAIEGKPLSRIEVHGKNLFYMFGLTPTAEQLRTPPAVPLPSLDACTVMHVHFGMSGAFRTMTAPGQAPTETTRLRLEHEGAGIVAHLSAMTVAHGGLELYHAKAAKLGPDPLREDADVEALWAKVTRCTKPIGLVLMDQTMMAGVGNIYRAEILYKAGIHPEQPANTLDRAAFEVVWAHSVELLQRGFVSGSIITVDDEDAQALGKPWTRRYIYNQRQCGRCKGPVKVWDMANRTVYCCETCQPLAAGRLPVARTAAMQAAKQHEEFRSHCAPDDPADMPLTKLTCAELRTQLKALNLDTAGKKAELVARLAAARSWAAGSSGPAPTEPAPPAAAAGSSRAAGQKLEAREPVTPPAAGPAALVAANVAPGAPSRTRKPRGPGRRARGDAEGTAAAAAAGAVVVTPRGLAAPASSADSLDRAEAQLATNLGTVMEAAAAHQLPEVVPGARPARLPAPGTRGLAGSMASAREAAEEKLRAGENRAVEHVALQDDATDALVAKEEAGAVRGGRRKRAAAEAGEGAAERPRRVRRRA